MNIFTRTVCVFFLSLLLAGQCALAKDYIIEMVFFANMSDPDQTLVQAPEPSMPPDLQDAVTLDDSALLHDFLPLPLDALKLADQAAALTESGEFRVLKHVAWLQPGLAKKIALPVRIEAGLDYSAEFDIHEPGVLSSEDHALLSRQPINELEGTVKVVLGRYLHVFTDLIYRRPVDRNTGTASMTSQQPEHDRILADFPLKIHRKMRSKELHYIDHPLFGILVEIWPAESGDGSP